MPNKIAFSGFPGGTTVTIGGVTVDAWGQVAGGGAVWGRAASAGTTVTVSAVRSDHQVAPEGMQFEVDLSGFDTDTAAGLAQYDPSYHDKVYFWDYEESYDFVAPTQVLALDAADGGDRKNSRYSRGPLGSHVFRTPGTYTVRCAVYEPSSGKWGQGSATVTVGDPDVLFAGSATIFVDTAGTYANAPAGAQTMTSLTAAMAALDAAITPHRIVLERGQTHNISAMLDYRPPSGATGVSLRVEAAAGAGAKPIIQANGGFSGSTMFQDRSLLDASGVNSGSVFRGLELRGPWDVTTETGNWGVDGVSFTRSCANQCLVDGCEIRGINVGFRTLNQATIARYDRTYFVNDTIISDWSNYGVFDPDSSRTNILGSRLAQNVDALAGGPKDDAHNNHGPFRCANPNRTVLLSSDLFSATGWSPAGSIQAIQPCIRWNTSAGVGAGAQFNMQSCVLESAGVPLIIAAASDAYNSRLVNAVIEGNMILGGFGTNRLIGVTDGGLTIRSNFLIYPDTQYNATSIGGLSRGPGEFISSATNGDGNLTDAANLAAPIRIYNNTLVNLSDVASAPTWVDAVMGFTDVAVANNIKHEPNLSSPNTPHAPLTSASAVTPRFKGYRPDAATLHTQFAPSADSGPLLTPQPASPALDASVTSSPTAAAGFLPDYSGIIAPADRDVGAVEA